jgi:hypothetical protein
MTAQLIAFAALLIAVIAFAHARRTARKLAMLEEQYWQLKFEHGELKARVDPSPESKPNFIPLIGLRQGAGPSTLPPSQGRPEQSRETTGSGPSRAASRDGETGSTEVR